MKYNQEQRYKIIQRNRNPQKSIEQVRAKLRKDFPVEVEYKDGFFIIESKMNYDNVYTQETAIPSI